jgi:hypothetical protein
MFGDRGDVQEIGAMLTHPRYHMRVYWQLDQYQGQKFPRSLRVKFRRSQNRAPRTLIAANFLEGRSPL